LHSTGGGAGKSKKTIDKKFLPRNLLGLVGGKQKDEDRKTKNEKKGRLPLDLLPRAARGGKAKKSKWERGRGGARGCIGLAEKRKKK